MNTSFLPLIPIIITYFGPLKYKNSGFICLKAIYTLKFKNNLRYLYRENICPDFTKILSLDVPLATRPMI